MTLFLLCSSLETNEGVNHKVFVFVSPRSGLALPTHFWSLAILGCAFGGKKSVFLAKHQKITGREEGFIPAPPHLASLSEFMSGGAGINPSSRPVIF